MRSDTGHCSTARLHHTHGAAAVSAGWPQDHSAASVQCSQLTEQFSFLCTWSSVVMAGDKPPWTQKMVLSITADKLHAIDDSIRL